MALKVYNRKIVTTMPDDENTRKDKQEDDEPAPSTSSFPLKPSGEVVSRILIRRRLQDHGKSIRAALRLLSLTAVRKLLRMTARTNRAPGSKGLSASHLSAPRRSC